MTAPAEVWLVRHAETASYVGDHGLTAVGRGQVQAAARELATALSAPRAELLHADSQRARQTAVELAAALRELDVTVAAPILDRGFDNFAAALGDLVVPHDQIRVALHAARHRPGWKPKNPLDWEHDSDRFASIQESGGDPIQWWLTQPTVAYEPPARVVRRFWRAMARLRFGGTQPAIVCTHSGPIRAVAAHALQYDPGEPHHVERLLARLHGDRAGDPAEITFRGRTVEMSIPTLEEPQWP
jgi:broad specificity phosphatase PhoE